MADLAIPSLTAGTAIVDADLIETVQGGNSRKSTMAQVKAFIPSTQPDYVAGRWYPAILGTPAISSNPGANIIQFIMVALVKPITISDLGAYITTLSVAGNLQLAIYANDPTTSRPTGNALATTGSISTTLAGVISADVVGSNVVLQPGFYWAAVNMDNGTCTIGGVASSFPRQPYMVGSTTLANIAVSNTACTLRLTFAQAFNTWPDMTGQALTESSTVAGPFLYMKAA